jgi:hypothetical protein
MRTLKTKISGNKPWLTILAVVLLFSFVLYLTTRATKSSDLNSDGTVNVLDLSVLLSKWGTTGAQASDINEDNTVNILDLSVLLSKWGTSGAVAPGTPQTLTLEAVADAYTDANSSNANHGSDTSLQISSNTYHARVRFNVAGLPVGAQVTDVTMKFYSTVAAPGSYVVRPSSDSWTESTLTNANQPAWDSTILSTSGALNANQTVYANIPVSAVPASGNISFGINTTSGVLGALASRESANKPKLVITYYPAGTSTPSPQPAPDPNVKPVGVTGNWDLKFQDEFHLNFLDTNKWFVIPWNTNNVTSSPDNLSVSDGILSLTLASPTSGATIDTAPWDHNGTGAYALPVGGYAEARVYFPGSATEDIYNWPAWWISGDDWPAAGEHDIAEGLGGDLTVNYHSPTGAHNQGAVPGTWGNAFHVYGVHRKATSADVYWDGVKVKTYSTDDNGGGQALILSVGAPGSRTPVTGTASQVKVDYVRAWEPAP